MRFGTVQVHLSLLLQRISYAPAALRAICCVSYDMKGVKSMEAKALTAAQIRAGRALLGWSAEKLAQEASLGLATVRRAEGSKGQTSLTAANDLSIRRALEGAGVVFIDGNGGGPGVHLK